MDLSGMWSSNAHYGMTRAESKKLYKHATEKLGIKMLPLESYTWWNTPSVEELRGQHQEQMERVTTTPSGQSMTATGVPLHVKNMRMQQNAQDLAIETRDHVIMTHLSEIDMAINKTMKNAIEESSLRAGQNAPAFIQDIANQLTEEVGQITEKVLEKVEANLKMYKSQEHQNQQQPQSNTTRELTSTSPDTWLYKYKVGGKEKTYCVPENYDFPLTLGLRRGFGLWLNGAPLFESDVTVNGQKITKKTPVMPYHMFGRKNFKLPRALAKKFGASWKVFKVMTEGVQLDPNKQYFFKEQDQLFYQGLKKIEDKAEYAFQQPGHME